ncbi:hypothetical protein HDU97_007402 [Phlyctochytrium planicorne]|nr:hypothetical protein HDU97_007402 [Phlyctochytrium planicorne]
MRADSLSHYISPVQSSWDINRQVSDPPDAVLSGFALNADNIDDEASTHKVIRVDGPTDSGPSDKEYFSNGNQMQNMEGPSITMIERRYKWLFFIQTFKDVEREREYERWYWKRNRKTWIRSIGYMLAAAVVYYLQFFVVAPVQSKSFREKTDLDPLATCGCYSYCQLDYNPVKDVFFFVAGNALPTGIILLIVHFTPTNVMARLVHYLSCLLVLILMTINFIVRGITVDPNGDSWFRAVLCMGIIFYPMMMKMSSFMTILCCSVVLLLYLVMFRGIIFMSDVATSSSQAVILTYMILCILLSVHLMAQFEASERRAFVINLGLVRNNDKLRQQLNHLQRKFKHKANDLDSPLEKALWTLKSILANPNLDMITHAQIDATIQWLSASENLFTPVFDRTYNDERMSLDDEQEASSPYRVDSQLTNFKTEMAFGSVTCAAKERRIEKEEDENRI